MSKRTLHALYFADDKDIFDVLAPAKQRLGAQKLIELARRRGILLSASETRETLVETICGLPHGLRQLGDILESSDSGQRRERVATASIGVKADQEALKHAIESVKSDRARAHGETYDIVVTDKGAKIKIDYTELDPSRSRLNQRTNKELTIDLEKTASGFKVRHQDQPKADAVLDALMQKLADTNEEKAAPVVQRIELSGITEPARRTKFFLALTEKIEGFKLEDVKAVKASRFASSSGDDDDDDDAAIESGEDDEVSADAAMLIAEVKKIALQGKRILDSDIYKNLVKKEYFVSAMTWTAKETKPDGIRAEFDAGFTNPTQGTGFSFTVRKIWERNNDNELKKTASPATKVKFEESRLTALLEGAASLARDDASSTSESDEG